MKKYLLVILLIAAGCQVFGQDIQSPNEFLPHQIGDQFTPHHLLVDYFQYIAQQSDRVKLVEYGQTHEHRPLLLAIISSPENLANLDNIRQDNLRRAGIINGKTNTHIGIVWLSFSVHGNEAAGAESALPLVFELTRHGGKVDQWLENTVVIIDPCINPDGYSRYTHWNRQVANRQLNVDINSVEHREPWPGGRTNHYYFDLNRDWAWQTQIESSQRIKQYQSWLPHIHADFHEMGYTSPYYFAPAAKPFHSAITEWQREFQDIIGRNHARYFNRNGWLFYTKEVFDLFYPSYGDTYPIFHGAIGMTYEQGGGSAGSRGVLLPTGDTLTLHDRVAHHVTTALSTIEAGSKHNARMLAEFINYFDQKPKSKYQSYVFKGEAGKLSRLTVLLDKNEIVYGQINKEIKSDGLDFDDGQTKSITIGPSDLIVNLDQPFGKFADILIEPNPVLEDSLTYDITSWSLPLAYGLNGYGIDREFDLQIGYNPPKPPIRTDDRAYGFVLPYHSVKQVKVLAAILRKDISVRQASVPFTIGDQSFPAGSLIVLRGDNRRHGEQLFSELSMIRAKYHEILFPVQSGYAEEGPDLGSNKMVLLSQPKVLLLTGEGTSSYGFGQIWHYFEQVINYPLSVVRVKDLGRTNLNQYQVLILPEGSFRLSDNDREKINDWVRKGGKIVAIGTGINSLNGNSEFSLKRKKPEKKDNSNEEDPLYVDRARHRISDAIPGGLFKVVMDPTHPLSFGLRNPYFSLKTNRSTYQKLDTGWNVGVLPDNLFYYGFVGYRLAKKLPNTLIIGSKSIGRGKVHYLIDNPLYRGFWEEGNLLFGNAVFF